MAPFLSFVSLTFAVTWILFLAAVKIPEEHHQGWQRLSPKSADRVCDHMLRPHGRDSALRQWGLHLAARGGKQVKSRAVVAVARKLAVLLHGIWTTQEPYMPFRTAAASS